jgi:hypothetical protein
LLDGLEEENEQDHHHHQRPVDHRYVDLAAGGLAGVADVQAGMKPSCIACWVTE